MANREELAIIRQARAGQADAQLQLGKLYLFGSASLPRSPATAIHWLDRAARQGCEAAWMAIGTHVAYEAALPHAAQLAPWFERAWQAGLTRAGIVFARLVLAHAEPEPSVRALAHRALEEAARAGFTEAQALLASAGVPLRAGARTPAAPCAQLAMQAAANRAWEAGDMAAFVAHALPLARQLARNAQAGGTVLAAPAAGQALLLSRCAQLLGRGQCAHQASAEEIRNFYELAANENEPGAQLALGLWLARMRLDGSRIADGGAANFKRAVRRLAGAAEQGCAEAWFALSRIYMKSEFSQRSVAQARAYLERAAELGYRDAQLECGQAAWRARREHEDNDVRALYWLQKAALQDCARARALLVRIAPPPALSAELQGFCIGQPDPKDALLGARLELAAAFGLTRAEALLIDVAEADRGHCLVVDIRHRYGRGKRRLVLVDSPWQRQVLSRAARLFAQDAGPAREGNYRQRLYRLKMLMGGAAAA